MMKRALDEDSPVNSVVARLAFYLMMAATAGAGVAIALRRHDRRSGPAGTGAAVATDQDPLPFQPDPLFHTGSHLADKGCGASVKSLPATIA